MKKLIDIIEKIKRQRDRFIIIINKSQYFDSSKAKFIIGYTRFYSNYELYLTDNGEWVEIKSKKEVIFLDKEKAGRILRNLNAVEEYEKYFNKLEVI
ncbi:hypothetical protein [Clostridium perfringens]|uniref:hypothetical protein n=1 Tax=Clostridium perfringens TaxID=1502 RepID=UPI0032DBD746